MGFLKITVPEWAAADHWADWTNRTPYGVLKRLHELEERKVSKINLCKAHHNEWYNSREECDYCKLEAENAKLRAGVDHIKVRAYELGQRELHDAALALLEEKADE